MDYIEELRKRTKNNQEAAARAAASSPPPARLVPQPTLEQLGIFSRPIHKPAPQAAPSPPKPAAPQPPRLQNQYMCQDCGQIWHVERMNGAFNLNAPRFCPACGSPTLSPAQSGLAGLDAACFKSIGVQRELAQLILQNWQGDERAAWPRFVDYLRKRLPSSKTVLKGQ